MIAETKITAAFGDNKSLKEIFLTLLENPVTESSLNIPDWFITLEKALTEKTQRENKIRIYRAVPVGFDNWQTLYHKFMIYILENQCVFFCPEWEKIDKKSVEKIIADIIDLHKSEETDKEKWVSLEKVASLVSEPLHHSSSSYYYSVKAAETSLLPYDWCASHTVQSAIDSYRKGKFFNGNDATAKADENVKLMYKSITEKFIELLHS